MKELKSRTLLFLVLFCIWVLLSLPLSSQELIVGGIVSLVTAMIPWRRTALLSEVKVTPKSILFSFAYVFVFLKALVLANLDVALRVLSPKLPGNSGIVRVKTKLTSRLGRLILANSITLTPGTITVETKDDEFYIHWIDIKGHGVEERTKSIVSGFEKYLEVLFG